MEVKAKIDHTESFLESHPSIYMIHVNMIPVYMGEYPPSDCIRTTFAYDAAEKLRDQLNELVPLLRKKLDSRHSTKVRTRKCDK